jgi:hypothetical protein
LIMSSRGICNLTLYCTRLGSTVLERAVNVTLKKQMLPLWFKLQVELKTIVLSIFFAAF